MKKIVLLLLIISSCSSKNKHSGKALDKAYVEFISGAIDKRELYNILKRDDSYIEKGITEQNKTIVISTLLYNEKYDELEKELNKMDVLISVQNSCEVPVKKYYLNLVKYLKSKNNKYINENIRSIEKCIRNNPKDSILYVEYFRMKTTAFGKEKVLLEIDSMKNENNSFSDIYYDYILKDAIKDYPEEFLPNYQRK